MIIPEARRRHLIAVLVFTGLLVAIGTAGAVRVLESIAFGGGSASTGHGALGKVNRQLASLGSPNSVFDEAAARRALIAVPLASEPFALVAAARMARNPKGQSGSEIALLTEALRRDPRSRPARVLLMRHMAANGDLKGAFGQLDVLTRLSPGLVVQAMEATTAGINSPDRVELALAALAGHPSLYEPFLSSMVSKKKSPEVVVRLAQSLPASVLQNRSVRNTVVRMLVDARQFALARSIWLAGNPGASGDLVHAPQFDDSQGSPPFNWKLAVGSTGAAEAGRNGGVTVVYYDREPGSLVSQVLALGPGGYRLEASFDVISGDAGNVHLRISCFDVASVLAEIPLTAARPGRNKVAAAFQVPAQACDGQILEIVGIASDRRGESELNVRRIDVLRTGSGQ